MIYVTIDNFRKWSHDNFLYYNSISNSWKYEWNGVCYYSFRREKKMKILSPFLKSQFEAVTMDSNINATSTEIQPKNPKKKYSTLILLNTHISNLI